MTPPPAQYRMSKRAGATVSEIKASHALYESQPALVATAIEQARRSLTRSSALANTRLISDSP